MNSHLIERYRTCKSSDEVVEMQETIQREMEDEAGRRRAEKGRFKPLNRTSEELMSE